MNFEETPKKKLKENYEHKNIYHKIANNLNELPIRPMK